MCSSRASTPARKPESFAPDRRITTGGELRTVARQGKRLRTQHFDVRAIASLLHLGHARLGLVVPKHGHSAVDRNRLKRRLRELWRRRVLRDAVGATGVDVVIHARPSAYTISFRQLGEVVEQLHRQLTTFAKRLEENGDDARGRDALPSDPSSPL